jgi:hypothetical protein
MQTAPLMRSFSRVALRKFQRALTLVCVIFAFGLAATAASQPRELLNSERIAAAFGSYGIEVLTATADTRVSNLYSVEAESRVCRTFAIVRYASEIAPDLAAAHAEIVRGGSMGAVLTAAGWTVRKRHLFFGEIPAGAAVAKLMAIPVGTRLAEHAYVLDVTKDGREFPYAALVEIHHPAYLGMDDLRSIYGEPDDAGREQLLATLLAAAAETASAR